MSINYYKCHGDCLEVIAVEGHLEPGDLCSICGGEFFHMGHVHQDTLVRSEDRTACNHSCTHAAGPRCDCRCGAVNHGSGRVVERTIINGIPHIPAYDIEKAIARRDEWRPVRMEIQRKMKALRFSLQGNNENQIRSYAYRSHVFSLIRTMNSKIMKLRSHFHRVKNGKAFIAKMDAFVESLSGWSGTYRPTEDQVNAMLKEYYNK